jgi:ABC-2 type transport system permease protein
MNVYRAHVASTLVPLLRTPVYWVPVVLFPVLLYSFFGIAPSQRDAEVARLLLGSWSAFAVIGVGFFQFGVSIAQARESTWEAYVRTLPVGGAPKLIAQITAAIVFTSLALGLLWVTAGAATQVRLAAGQYALLAIILAAGAAPFVLMGAALGYIAPARGAVPIANLFYLPLAYFGGLWTPPGALPEPVAAVSLYTPTRHLGELAWAATSGRPVPWESVSVLAVYAAGAGVIALIMWRRDENVRSR